LGDEDKQQRHTVTSTEDRFNSSSSGMKADNFLQVITAQTITLTKAGYVIDIQRRRIDASVLLIA
jgi:hypothetical protein